MCQSNKKLPLKDQIIMWVPLSADMINLPLFDIPMLIISALWALGKSTSWTTNNDAPPPSSFFLVTLYTRKILSFASETINALNIKW